MAEISRNLFVARQAIRNVPHLCRTMLSDVVNNNYVYFPAVCKQAFTYSWTPESDSLNETGNRKPDLT
jgi:hypothetical protein